MVGGIGRANSEPGGGGREDGEAGFAAYSKGFRDGQANRKFDPIVDPPDEAAAASKSSSWGIGSLFSLMMVGSMLMQMAGQPPSVANLMANARNMGPMQAMILLNVLSSLF